MKAILVIEMPSCCVECPFFEFTNGDDPDDCRTHCIAKLGWINEYGADVRPSWCPLKPMPSKRETQVHWKSIGGGDIPTHEISDYDKGWNDCVEFLEGELND